MGRMGAAMAGRIARSGADVIVWNRTNDRAERVAAETGARVAASPAEATAAAPIVISSLADDEAVRRVYLDAGGVVEGCSNDTLVLETSTIDPTTVHDVGAAVDRTGAHFLDAPVSGSVASVESGTLTIMVGGPKQLFDRARPTLELISSRQIRVGERGSGAATKLAVNGLVHGLNVALSEALVLAERAGVDRTTAYEVFASGAGGAPFVQYKRDAYENPDAAPVAFSLDLVKKDLDLITGLAKRVGAPMRQAETGRGLVTDAIESGFGDRDLSAIAAYLREESST